jgi:annexin A7/11
MRNITHLYKTTYNRELSDHLSEMTKGSFGRLCVNLTKPPSHVDAEYVQAALNGVGSDKDLLTEVLCMRTNGQLVVIKQAYMQLYGKDLEHVLKKELKGPMERLFLGMVKGNRDEVGQYMNVEDDMDVITQCLRGKAFSMGGDRTCTNTADPLIEFLTNRSYAQIQAVFRAIAQRDGKPMSKIIKERFQGSLEKVLLSIEYAVNDFPSYVATRFEECMVGTGLRDETIIRVISRCRDPELLAKFKDTYTRIYGKTLRERIESKASGEFKRLAAALVS